MTRILFVCHGNICRSVMAQYMFENEIVKRGLGDLYEVDSCATSREEIGNTMYPPAKRKLDEKGVAYGSHRSRQFTKADYDKFDRIFIMDENNRRNIFRIIDSDPNGKIETLLPDRSIADPWYTGNFEETYQDILEGIARILG